MMKDRFELEQSARRKDRAIEFMTRYLNGESTQSIGLTNKDGTERGWRNDVSGGTVGKVIKVAQSEMIAMFDDLSELNVGLRDFLKNKDLWLRLIKEYDCGNMTAETKHHCPKCGHKFG